jgi:hypothetical protein
MTDSPWKKWKEAQGESRPWHLIDPSVQKVEDQVAALRLSMCRSCEHLIKATTQCSKCGCFMQLKTKLANAECPIGKWARADSETL